jgi:hypothetical protein
MGVDFEPVELVEEEGLEFAGDLVGRDAGGEEDCYEQKRQYD